MDEQKLKKSFQLVKEDTQDIYNRLDELSEKVDEMQVTQRTLADKIVKKVDKKQTKTKKKKRR